MVIIPKVSNIADIIKLSLEAEPILELQAMTRHELECIFTDLREYATTHPNLQEVTIHWTAYDVNFELSQITDYPFMEQCIHKAQDIGIPRVNILWHIDTATHYLAGLGAIRSLEKLLHLCEGSNTYLLLENTIASVNTDCKLYSPAYAVVEQICHPHLQHCFDLVHHKIGTQIKHGLDTFPRSCPSYTHQIHFSSVIKGDGYMDKSTHGCRHMDISSILSDLAYLDAIGFDLDTVHLVLEINEKNFKDRPDLLWELGAMIKIDKSGILTTIVD